MKSSLEVAIPVTAFGIYGIVAKVDPSWYILGWCIGEIGLSVFRHYRGKKI